MGKTTKTRAGFTLLEVLIALTIFSLVLIAIYGSLHMGLQAWEKGEGEAESRQEARIVLDLIPQQIRSLYPYKFKEGNEELPAFRGDRRSIRFISTLSLTSRAERGLTFVSYFLDPKEGLMLCEKRIFKKEMFADSWNIARDSVPFSPLISAISFAYETEDEEWVEEWDIKEMLVFPRSVKVTLTYRDGASDRKNTTTQTVALPAGPSQ